MARAIPLIKPLFGHQIDGMIMATEQVGGGVGATAECDQMSMVVMVGSVNGETWRRITLFGSIRPVKLKKQCFFLLVSCC